MFPPTMSPATIAPPSELDTVSGPGVLPRFDLILLGMGPDGHTASLFPGSESLSEVSRRVVTTPPGMAPYVPRITLTMPVLNNAANVIFLAAGQDKAEMAARVLGPSSSEPFPAQRVQPAEGSLTWLLDRAAAGSL